MEPKFVKYLNITFLGLKYESALVNILSYLKCQIFWLRAGHNLTYLKKAQLWEAWIGNKICPI